MKILRRGTALALSLAMVVSLVAGGLLIRTVADTAMQWNNADWDELSRYYETGSLQNSPASIATTPGDPGGKSYGMYMFASRAGTPHAFAEWCKKSESSVYRDIGDTLDEAYHYISDGYGTYFDNAWRGVASTYGATFGSAQYDYTKELFYNRVVSLVESTVSGFDIDNYSVALKNVFWSRSVQHGPDDAASLIKKAFNALGGFANQPEGALIEAIYGECGRLVTAAELYSENGRSGEAMSGDTSDKYGTTGKILRYFFGSSGDVQIGVYRRLGVNELADALVMLMNNGYQTAPKADGSYRLLYSSDQKWALDGTGGTVQLNVSSAEAAGQSFALTWFAGGFYTISTTAGDSTLRLTGGGSGVSLAAPSAADSQKWVLEQSASGYLLKNLQTGTYLCCQNGTLVMTAAAEGVSLTGWQPVAATATTADWSVRGLIYPNSESVLVAGNSSFPVRGVISCSSPITSVTIKATGKSSTPINVTVKPGTTSYDLKRLDDSVPYSALTAGDYTLTLTAVADGKTFELARSQFTVSSNNGQIHDDETFTITFDPNGGTLSGSSTKTVSLDDIVYGKLPTASKPGYSFVGWFTGKEDGEQITAATKVIASDLTLYARYADVYTYTFLDAEGDTYVVGTTTVGEPIPAPGGTPSKAPDGQYIYKFSHWEGYTEGQTVMKAENMTFKPVYTATPVTDGAGYWTGLTPGSTVEKLGSGVTVYDGDTAMTSGTLRTGMTAVVREKQYTLVVTGDVNGDGRISITDVVALQAHVVGKQTLTGAYAEAADLNNDGRISITDVVKAARVIVGKDTIG